MVLLIRLVQAALGSLLGLALAYGVHPGNLVLIVAALLTALVFIAATKRERRILPGWWATAAGIAGFFAAVGGPASQVAFLALIPAVIIGVVLEVGARGRVRVGA